MLLGPLSILALSIASHPGASIYLQLLIEPGAVELQVFGEQRVLNPLLGLEGPFTPPVEDRWIAAAQAAAGPLLARDVELWIDGAAVAASLAEVAFDGPSPANHEPTLRLRARFAAAASPERVHLGWRIFDEGGAPIPVLFRREGDPPDFQQLTPLEPACDWIARGLAAPRGAPGAHRPPAVAGARRVLPWRAALALLAAGVLGAVFARNARQRAALLALGCLGAALLLGVARARGARPLAPDPDAARAIFAALHARIYQALAAESEDGVYELLASAVDADVLDELFGEVYEGLVLRNEGGAVCRIDAVEPRATAVELGPGSDSDAVFEVVHEWTARGSVSHWGHTHERTNAYRARYSVAHDGEGWKIAAWEVLEHRRKDDARSFVTLVGDEPEPDSAAEESTATDPSSASGDGQ